MLLEYKGKWPKLGERVYIAGGTYVIGDVEIGDHSSIWFNCVIRGDVHYIRIGRNTRQCWILKLYRATPFKRRSGWINQHAHPQMFHVAHEPWSFLRTQLASGLQYTSFSKIGRAHV